MIQIVVRRGFYLSIDMRTINATQCCEAHVGTLNSIRVSRRHLITVFFFFSSTGNAFEGWRQVAKFFYLYEHTDATYLPTSDPHSHTLLVSV